MERRYLHARSLIRAALLMAGVLCSISACDIQESREGAGTALDFTLELVSGEWFDAAELYGSVVLLNFWDTSCGACEHEQSDLNRLFSDFHMQGLELVGVTYARDGRAAAERYLREHAVPYSCGYFGAHVLRVFGSINALPTTIVIARAGAIDTTTTGKLSHNALAALVAPLL